MQQTTVANPFVLMLDPASVLAQIARSERLDRLERHVCRPLDKPLLQGKSDLDDEDDVGAAFDGADDGESPAASAGLEPADSAACEGADHAQQ